MKVKCIYNVPMYGDYYWGLTLYPFILFKDSKEDVTEWKFRHEWQHVLQVREEGVIRFYLSYLRELFKCGYLKNKYEVEARAVQNNLLTDEERRIFENGGE